ncbi:MAG: cation:proton antiporter [Elusimicrobiota bacterium]|jgi:multicomponent Na+:H+ antiporter subunit F
MKQWRWWMGAGILVGIVAMIVLRPLPFLFYPKLSLAPFFGRALYILILASLLCLYRVARGPTGADRIVAVDLLGVMITGLCAVLAITTRRTWYLDIGIAWALQSFITVLALCKFLEGKDFDD